MNQTIKNLVVAAVVSLCILSLISIPTQTIRKVSARTDSFNACPPTCTFPPGNTRCGTSGMGPFSICYGMGPSNWLLTPASATAMTFDWTVNASFTATDAYLQNALDWNDPGCLNSSSKYQEDYGIQANWFLNVNSNGSASLPWTQMIFAGNDVGTGGQSCFTIEDWPTSLVGVQPDCASVQLPASVDTLFNKSKTTNFDTMQATAGSLGTITDFYLETNNAAHTWTLAPGDSGGSTGATGCGVSYGSGLPSNMVAWSTGIGGAPVQFVFVASTSDDNTQAGYSYYVPAGTTGITAGSPGTMLQFWYPDMSQTIPKDLTAQTGESSNIVYSNMFLATPPFGISNILTQVANCIWINGAGKTAYCA
jgi:hypothetical protein